MRRRTAWRDLLAVAAVLAAAPIVMLRLLPPLPVLASQPQGIATLLAQPLAAMGLPWLIRGAAWGLWATLLIAALVGGWRRARRWRLPRLRLPGPAQTVSAALLGTVAASTAAPPVAAAVHTTLAAATDPVRLGTTSADFPDAASATGRPAATTSQPSLIVTAPVRPPIGTAGLRVSTVEGSGYVLVSSATTDPPAPVTQPLVYQVRRGDWLGGIAARFLGDFNRYPEIQKLNPTLINNPDLIQPAWQLVLPADAHDHGLRLHATGQVVPPPAAAPPDRSDPPQPAPAHPPTTGTPSTSATPPASRAPAPPPVAGPDTTGSATASAASRSAPSATRRDLPPDSTGPATRVGPDHRSGVNLPGGWIGLPLAAALVTVAATVWLHRRRRYIPTSVNTRTLDDPDLRPLPPVLTRLRRAVREQAPELLHPAPQHQPTVAEYLSSNPDQPAKLPPIGPSGPDLAGLGDRIPPGGLGLVGPGAESAARALLVATLSSGSPADPDARGQVVIPTAVLTTLLGTQARHVGPIPRLVVTANLPDALTRLEDLLIERRRLLDEYEATDLDQIRAAEPFHPPMPPVLLVVETPPTELHTRLTTTLHLASPLQISAVMLGERPHGDTLTVEQDGRTTSGDHERLAVLDAPTTLQLLAAIQEAHTGQPPITDGTETTRTSDGADPVAPTANPATAPAQPDAEKPAPDKTTAPATATPPRDGDPATDTGHANPDPNGAQPPTAADATGNDASAADPRPGRRQPIRIQLLGPPAIFDRHGSEVPGLRHHARELLVYLAVHRNGADLPQIMEALWPTATVRRAAERLSTEAGDLRRRIRQAAGDKNIQPVVNTGGRYHLDPNLLDIDVWRLTDALRQATAATDPAARITALRHAVQAHTGGLAEGHDYDWIEQPRDQLRRNGIKARLHLAQLLRGTQPRAAADLTVAAARLDPLNEDLTRHAMRALAAIGDAAGIRAQLHRLRTALDEIDEQPSTETIALAAQLQHDINTTGRADQPPDNPPPADTE